MSLPLLLAASEAPSSALLQDPTVLVNPLLATPEVTTMIVEAFGPTTLSIRPWNLLPIFDPFTPFTNVFTVLLKVRLKNGMKNSRLTSTFYSVLNVVFEEISPVGALMRPPLSLLRAIRVSFLSLMTTLRRRLTMAPHVRSFAALPLHLTISSLVTARLPPLRLPVAPAVGFWLGLFEAGEVRGLVGFGSLKRVLWAGLRYSLAE